MGHKALSLDILEVILKYLDGESLLMCMEVSPEFAAAVKYLGRTINIWKDHLLRESRGRYPYDVLAKFYPYAETPEWPKDWGLLYEAFKFGSRIRNSGEPRLFQVKLGKFYSKIEDLEVFGSFILVLLKYNKNCSKYRRIIVLNSKARRLDKSGNFHSSMIFISPMYNPERANRNAIVLYCEYCDILAIPLSPFYHSRGYPKFFKYGDYLKVLYRNRESYWFNPPSNRKLLTFGSSIYSGFYPNYAEARYRDWRQLKIFHTFTTLTLCWGRIRREFQTFHKLRAMVSGTLHYGGLLLLGTNTGALYAYKLENETDLDELDLEFFDWHFDVCSRPIFHIRVMELIKDFVIVCASDKYLYTVRLERKLNNLYCYSMSQQEPQLLSEFRG